MIFSFKLLLFLAILPGVVLSGCMEEAFEDREPSPNEDIEDNNDDASRKENRTDDVSYPRNAIWHDCKGFITGFDWIGEHERFNPPPEWDLGPTGQHATRITIHAIECERFTLDSFERPVKFLIDFAGVNAVPDSCWRDNVTIRFTTMQTIWFNDTELVDYLRDTYNMPAYYADIDAAWETNSPLDEREYVWTMTHDDGDVSYFRTPEIAEPSPPSKFLYRIFWFNETSVSYMDWGTEDAASNSQTFGEAHPPLSLGDWHTREYIGAASITHALDAEGEIAMFHDKMCRDEIE